MSCRISVFYASVARRNWCTFGSF